MTPETLAALRTGGFRARQNLRRLLHVAAFACAVLCAGGAAFSQQQATASVNESFRYGAGKEVQLYGAPAVNKEYLENFTTAKISIGDFFLTFRYQVFDSSELYGQKFQGFDRRYIEYRKNGLYVRAGNIYSIFGKGLALNLFENTSIYYDNNVDGLKLGYRTAFAGIGADATALAGTMTFTDFTDPNDIRVEHYHLQAGEIGFSPQLAPFRNTRIAFDWVHATGVLPSPAPQFGVPQDSLDATLPAMNINVSAKNIEWYFEYAAKRADVAPRPQNGTGGVQWSGGLYSEVTFTQPGFGATLEYKNYHYDIVNYTGQANQIFLSTKALPFQNAPTLYKEQSYTLITRVQHPVDFNDEVGFQLDGFWSPDENLTVNFNAAAATQHFKDTSGATWTLSAPLGGFLRLPYLNPAYSFWEEFGEIEYDFHGDSYVKIAFDRTAVPTKNALASIPESSTAAPLIKGEYSISDRWSINWDFENQWIHNPSMHADTTAPRFFAPDANTYFSQLLSAGFTLSPYGGVTAVYEWTTQTDDISGRRNWFLLEGTIRIGGANMFIVSYGNERGGIRCSNGICRYINPFSGWRLTFTSQL